jgi:hypothetical protein
MDKPRHEHEPHWFSAFNAELTSFQAVQEKTFKKDQHFLLFSY